METHAFGFRLRANALEGQKQFPISNVTLVERLRLHRELKPGQPQYQKQKDQLELEEVDPGKASPLAWITEKHRRDGAV